MSTPNPLAPQGSLLEQQSRGRSTFQIISFIGALHVVFLCGLLWIGCKKEEAPKPPEAGLAADGLPPLRESTPVNPPVASTDPALAAQNPVAEPATNVAPAPVAAPLSPPPLTPPPPAPETPVSAGTTHKVQKGDTGMAIAKRHGVTLKALQEANPNVNWNRLKLDDVLQIPAASAPASPAPGGPAPAVAPEAAADGSTYQVKAGDTGTKIAKATGVSWKRIRAANNLKSDSVRVGQKLKIPAGGTAAAPSAPAPAPVAVPLAPPAGAPAAPAAPVVLPR